MPPRACSSCAASCPESGSKIAQDPGSSVTPSSETKAELMTLRMAFSNRWFVFGCQVGLCGRSAGGGERRLGVADARLGNGGRDRFAADEREDRRNGEQADRAEHPERLLESAGKRRGGGVAGVKQRLGVAGRDTRGDGDPDRAAELLAGVQQSGREPGLLLLYAGEC